MSRYCLPWLAAFCFAAISGAVAGKESLEEPSVAISLASWRTEVYNHLPSSLKARQSFSIGLKVAETSPAWKVAYGGMSGSELSLTDSEGCSPAKVNSRYSKDSSPFRRDTAGTIFTRASSWRPSEKARWVDVKGDVPLVMYSQTALSERVTLKPAVKDFSVPLLLKDAREDGVDVKIELKGYYLSDSSGHELRVIVRSSSLFGFLGVKLYSPDGAPLVAKNSGFSTCSFPRNYEWRLDFVIQEGKKMEELNVAVQYASGLKKVMVPVRVRCGLSGVVEQQDTLNKEN